MGICGASREKRSKPASAETWQKELEDRVNPEKKNDARILRNRRKKGSQKRRQRKGGPGRSARNGAGCTPYVVRERKT